MSGFLEALRDILWGPHVLLLILAAGAYFSYESCFFQLFHPIRWLKAALGGGRGRGSGRFRAIATALAGSIGTGNIVGVAAAITVGGPGALFWMCASAVLGMMTVYTENYFAARARQKGAKAPGPLSYIEKAGRLGGVLAGIYALGCALSSLAMGNMVQVNALGAAAADLGIPVVWTAPAVGILVLLVARGGLKAAGRLAEKLVPAMTLIFFAASLGALWVHRENLPAAAASIFDGAFSLRAGAGGTAGMLIAMSAGVSRGVFTNEAGLGSSAFAYTDVTGHTPGEIGAMGIFQVFADTVVMCTVTGLCILCSCPPQGLEGAELTFYAYRSALGPIGGAAVSLCTALFALATVIAWCCYGKEGLMYLTKGRGQNAYAAAAGAAAFLGCLLPLGEVFLLGDAMNGLMAIPNVLALFWAARHSKSPLDGSRRAAKGGRDIL